MTGASFDLESEVQDFANQVLTRVLMCLVGEPREDTLRIVSSDDRYAFSYQQWQRLHAQHQDLCSIANEFDLTMRSLLMLAGFAAANPRYAGVLA